MERGGDQVSHRIADALSIFIPLISLRSRQIRRECVFDELTDVTVLKQVDHSGTSQLRHYLR
jgi:hypothetical protein